MQHCILKRLEEERPKLKDESLLPGLLINRGQPTYQENYFTCCNTLGIKYSEKDNTSMDRCELSKRLVKIRSLVEQFYSHWKLFGEDIQRESMKCGQGLFSITDKEAEVFWKRMLEFRMSSCLRGYQLVLSEKEKLKPSRLWWLALNASWRLGLKCLFITMGTDINKSLYKIFEDEKRREKQNGEKSIFFVEKIDKLWDANTLFDFEVMVNYCYDRRIPMWLEFIGREVNSSDDKKTSEMSFKPVSRRVAALKAKSYKEWLSEGLRLKLSEISDEN